MWRADMSIWIYLLMLLIQSIINTDGVFYHSEEAATAQTASVCNLATPDIHFGISEEKVWNTVSLDGADLNIADGESVWSGYVQTYAAFLYEGCCEAIHANSSAIYKNIARDPGECYSKCKTDVIGMQFETCHCNPCPEERNKHATGCSSTCSNPKDTACGGDQALSIYRKVEYPAAEAAGQEGHNCRALYWRKDDKNFYKWNTCTDQYIYMCDNTVDNTSATELYVAPYSWSSAAGQCLQHGQKPAMELSSGYPDLNASRDRLIWIGQIRSRVIGKYADSNFTTPGWRRGVITKAGGQYVLLFHTYPTELKSLCENVSTSTPSPDSTTQTTASTHLSSSTTTHSRENQTGSEYLIERDDETQFPMIAVYIVVPVVLILFMAVVVIVIIWKRRQCHAKESAEPPDYVNSVHHAEMTTTSETDFDRNQYETCSRTDSAEHQYSALEHSGDYEHGISTNVDNAYENQIASSANVYINT